MRYQAGNYTCAACCRTCWTQLSKVPVLRKNHGRVLRRRLPAAKRGLKESLRNPAVFCDFEFGERTVPLLILSADATQTALAPLVGRKPWKRSGHLDSRRLAALTSVIHIFNSNRTVRRACRPVVFESHQRQLSASQRRAESPGCTKLVPLLGPATS